MRLHIGKGADYRTDDEPSRRRGLRAGTRTRQSNRRMAREWPERRGDLSMTYCIGIDPGLHGAVAVLRADGALLAVHDCPILAVRDRKRTRHVYDIPSMGRLLRDILAEYGGEVHTIIERVHAIPSFGPKRPTGAPVCSAVGNFSLGAGLYTWLTWLVALTIPYDAVDPARWKRAMLSDLPKGKGSSRVRAAQLWPLAIELFRRSDDRAEAALLAEYHRRHLEVSEKQSPGQGAGR